MSVTVETPITSATANGVTTVFPYAFTVLDGADLKVIGVLDGVATTYTLGVHYTVSGLGAGSGSVTFLSPPAAGTVITLFRDSLIQRTTDYQEHGDLPASLVNQDFDRLWLVLQEIFNGGKGSPTSLRVPSGETVVQLPSRADRAGKIVAFDSNGEPVAIVGVDAGSAAALDLSLRDTTSAATNAGQVGFLYSLAYATGTVGRWLKDLLLSTGAGFIGWIQAGAGAVLRTVADKLTDTASVFDWMTKAQIDDVRSGTRSIDITAAVQAAVTSCGGQNGRRLRFPAGDYGRISAPILIPNFSDFVGDGRDKTRFSLQGMVYAGEIFKNADAAAMQFISIRGIGFRGGSYAIRNTAPTQQNFSIQNCAFEIQTIAGIVSEHDWQLNTLRDCVFYYCTRGMWVVAGFANMNVYDACEFDGLDEPSFWVQGSAEVNKFIGCRFEAGGVAGKHVIDLATSRNTSFDGCYFEAVHNVLLYETNANGTSFENCHFTGALSSAASPFIFTSDGVVHFGPNTWGVSSAGALRMRLTGDNAGLAASKLVINSAPNRQTATSSVVNTSTPSATVTLASISRVITDGSLNDLQCCCGKITFVYSRTTSGGVQAVYAADIPFVIEGLASAVMTVTLGAAVVAKTSVSTETFSFSAVGMSSSSGQLQVVIGSIPAGTQAGNVSWSIDVTSTANQNYKPIVCAIA